MTQFLGRIHHSSGDTAAAIQRAQRIDAPGAANGLIRPRRVGAVLDLDVGRPQQLPTGPDHGFETNAVPQVAAVAHAGILSDTRDPRQGRDLVGDTARAYGVDRHLQQQRCLAPDTRDAIFA